jgi:hypothetical protein
MFRCHFKLLLLPCWGLFRCSCFLRAGTVLASSVLLWPSLFSCSSAPFSAPFICAASWPPCFRDRLLGPDLARLCLLHCTENQMPPRLRTKNASDGSDTKVGTGIGGDHTHQNSAICGPPRALYLGQTDITSQEYCINALQAWFTLPMAVQPCSRCVSRHIQTCVETLSSYTAVGCAGPFILLFISHHIFSPSGRLYSSLVPPECVASPRPFLLAHAALIASSHTATILSATPTSAESVRRLRTGILHPPLPAYAAHLAVVPHRPRRLRRLSGHRDHLQGYSRSHRSVRRHTPRCDTEHFCVRSAPRSHSLQLPPPPSPRVLRPAAPQYRRPRAAALSPATRTAT